MDEQNLVDRIAEAEKNSGSYPEAAAKLSKLGIQSYTVEVSSGIALYRFKNGKIAVRASALKSRKVEGVFQKEKFIQTLRDHQAGTIDFSDWIGLAAESGVRFYEATLTGENRKVTYIGIGGLYAERIAE